MTGITASDCGLDPGTIQWVKGRIKQLKNLPEPGEAWLYRDVEGLDDSLLSDLQRRGVIKRIGRCHERQGDYVLKYQTTRNGYQAIEEIKEQNRKSDGFLPCEDETCTSNRFISKTDTVVCKGCGEEHKKEDLR